MKAFRLRGWALSIGLAATLLPASATAEIAANRLSPQITLASDIRAVTANDDVIALGGLGITIIDRQARDLTDAIALTSLSARLITDLTSHEGRFFAVGVAESTTTTSSSPPINLINPDSVTVDGSLERSFGLARLALIEFSSTGEVRWESLFDAPTPLIPRSLKVIGDQIGIVGSIASERGVQGFLATSDLAGQWQSFERYGDASTEINSLASLRILYGTSGERLAGSPVRGRRDGVIFYLDVSQKLNRVVRSSLSSSERSWQSASSAHLAIGPVTRAGVEEVAITKFSSTGVPQWFIRYPGRDPHLFERTVGFITNKRLTGLSAMVGMKGIKGNNAIFIDYGARAFNKRSSITRVSTIAARSLIDMGDGYAVISDLQGRTQLVSLAP